MAYRYRNILPADGGRAKQMMWALVLSLLLWMPGSTTWQALWIERWGILVSIIGAYSIYQMRWRHWTFPLALSYVFVMACVAAFKGGFGVPVPWDMNLMLQHSSLYWLACMLAFLLFLNIPMRPKELLFPLQLGALVMLVGMILAKNPRIQVPILANPSTAACYIVLMSFWGARVWLLMGVIACFLSGAATPTAAFAVGVFLLIRSRIKWVLVPVVALGTFWYLSQGGVDSGRFSQWYMYASWWRQQDELVKMLGVGFGTTKVILPYLALKTVTVSNPDATIFPFLHNDWLQFFGELGFVGAGIVIAAIYKLFESLGRRGRIVMVVYSTIAITNFPSHYPLLALTMWGLIKFGAMRRKPYEIL